MIDHTKLAIAAIIIVIPIASFVVYNSDSNQQKIVLETTKLHVVSSFYPLHEFAQNIGKEKIDAVLLVPVGVEPHDWEPTIKDVQRIQSADFVIINGIGFEKWINNLDDDNFQGIIIDTSDGILDKFDQDNNKLDEQDPHIWLNPVYAKIQVQNIANAFSTTDPVNKEYYQHNAANYLEQLDLLDLKIKTELSSCKSDFIAFHDAFSYFAKEYDLTQHTIISSNDPHGEVTAKTLENIISTAREFNATVIFSEEFVNHKTSEIIAREIGGKVLVLSPLEIVSDDTYISKMTKNLENLKEALC